MISIGQLLESVEALPKVPLKVATAYSDVMDDMVTFVNDSMSADDRINELVGQNPLKMMYDNHKHHAAFMVTVFTVSAYGMLVSTLPWVYRSYHNHNFLYEYFEKELGFWLIAVEKYLQNQDSSSIQAIYRWMLDQHQQIIKISEQADLADLEIDPQWLEKKNHFTAALLKGDHTQCLELASSESDIESFYLYIVQPALYDVGLLWERAEISVAQEHLASAIASRVMAAMNLKISPGKYCGKAVIAASPNEFHEIGPLMISDILEKDGWQVSYLGANVPQADLLNYLEELQPDILAISVTIAFNVNKAADIIVQIKQSDRLKNIKVIVGGRVFNDNDNLWETIGADGFAVNLQSMRKLTEQWRVH